MANKKLTDLTELTTPADGDFLYIVDVSDTTESAQGTSKKIRKDKVDSGASKENIANKQNDLTPDGTGTKYPTVDAVNAGLPTNYSKIVYVNATSPITATIFDTENPPVTNDNLLKNDVANLYIDTDANTWVYETGTGYRTETVTATSSNFYLAGTTTDAGNTKTGHISRTGNITTTGKLGASGTSYFATNATDKTYIGTSTLNPNNSKFVIKGTVTGGTNIESILDNSGNVIFNIDNSGNTLLGATSSESNFAKLGIKGLGTDDIQAWVNSSGVLKSKINNVGSFISSSDVSASNIVASQFMAISPNKALNGNSGGSLALFSKNTYWESLGKIKYASDYSITYDARTLVDKAYTDAKITQTITNGVTDKSPSEDAVYDAIDGVVKTIISDTPTSTNTGGVSEVLMHTYPISGGKLPTSCMPNLKIRLSKVGTSGTVTLRVKVNSVNDFATSTAVGIYTSTNTVTAAVFVRNLALSGGNLATTVNSVSLINDEVAQANGTTSFSYDPSVTQYWFVSLQNSDSTDTTRVRSIKLVN